MTEEEVYEMQQSVTNRLADYANCSKESAHKMLMLIYREYTTKGDCLYSISDRLSSKGY